MILRILEYIFVTMFFAHIFIFLFILGIRYSEKLQDMIMDADDMWKVKVYIWCIICIVISYHIADALITKFG